MNIIDDETLNMYVTESLEHLADIETDFLYIEEKGKDIDESLVNKVFRAIHSIKGGAGFMGLNIIKELSHKMENILDMIRSHELVPNSAIISILLKASDTLVNLIKNVTTSNDQDISDHVKALTSINENTLSDEQKDSASKIINISFPGGLPLFQVSEFEIIRKKKKGNYFYLFQYDLIHDIHEKDINPLEMIKEMEKSGTIIDCKVDIAMIGDLSSDTSINQIPFIVLFSTVIEEQMIDALLKIDQNKIFLIEDDFTIKPLSEEKDEEEKFTKIADISRTKSLDDEKIKNSVQEKKVQPDRQEAVIKKSDSPPAVQENTKDPQSVADLPASKVKKTSETSDNIVEKTAVAAESDSNLRVNLSLLDSLMNLAGELVLGRNQLLQAISRNDVRSIESSGQRLDLITSELQEAIMQTRMQPIGNVFNRFKRVVRDLSAKLGKNVKLVIEGNDVEMDKTIIEAISDPLTHLIRNAVDHGLEIPDERFKAGKNDVGNLLLKAYHEAGQVSIDISDDGKGMDGNYLGAKSVEKGLIKKSELEVMSEREKLNLIFHPGFSTAKEVTDVSGRGVGMDVVKTNLDKLGGTVDIESTVGEGTNIKIKLPLTLAIIPSQIIISEGDRYAIPQINMDELLRIPAAQIKEKIEVVGNAEVVRLRGQLLPLLNLSDALGVKQTYMDTDDKTKKSDRRKQIADRRFSKRSLPEDDTENQDNVENMASNEKRRNKKDRRYHAGSAVNIVVVSTGRFKYGLVVDKLIDSEEIVVKPLGRHLKHFSGYAGATIMGDGKVALILDVANLAMIADLASIDSSGAMQSISVEEKSKVVGNDRQSFLLFRSAADEQFAVHLNLVQHIEKIKKSNIEMVGGKRLIQYRKKTLPIFTLDDIAKVKPIADRDNILGIVFNVFGRDVGLLATSPVDAIELDIELDNSTLKQPGIMGSSIINNQTTLMVDIFNLVETLEPQWFNLKDVSSENKDDVTTILFAEDSRFFRSQVKGYFDEVGCKVIEAEDGAIAWDLLNKHYDKIDIVVTDIEMPNLDGFEFTQMIRQDERFKKLPVMALTTLASEKDIEKGKTVGIDDYQIKLNKEKLIESIFNFIAEK